MIYCIVQQIQNLYSSGSITMPVLPILAPDKTTGDYTLVREFPGSIRTWPDNREDRTFQIQVFTGNFYDGETAANLVGNYYRERFSHTLPAHSTKTGSVAIDTTKIETPSMPYFLQLESQTVRWAWIVPINVTWIDATRSPVT